MRRRSQWTRQEILSWFVCLREHEPWGILSSGCFLPTERGAGNRVDSKLPIDQRIYERHLRSSPTVSQVFAIWDIGSSRSVMGLKVARKMATQMGMQFFQLAQSTRHIPNCATFSIQCWYAQDREYWRDQWSLIMLFTPTLSGPIKISCFCFFKVKSLALKNKNNTKNKTNNLCIVDFNMSSHQMDPQNAIFVL